MRSALSAFAALLLFHCALHAQFVFANGTLVTERGPAYRAFDPREINPESVGRPYVPVEIRVVCDGRTLTSAHFGGTGAFRLRLQTGSGRSMASLRQCFATAYLPGFRSDPRQIEFPNFGRIVLHREEGASGRILSLPSLTASADSRRLFAVALSLRDRNALEQAKQELQKLVNTNPQYAQAWYELGVMQMSGETDAARASFQKAIDSDPLYVFPYQQLMRLNAWDARWDKVLANADELLKLCPHDYPEGSYDLAFAFDHLGRPADAEAAARRGVQEDPGHTVPELHRLLGNLLTARGDRAGAEQQFRIYLQWCPGALDRAYIESMLPALATPAGPDSTETVAELIATVRFALNAHRSDERVAHVIRNIKLAERLDDRTVETLESYGAGRDAVAELLHLRDRSVHLPPPRTPAIAMPAPPSAPEQKSIWESAAEKSLGYSSYLPDFICTEMIRRFDQSTDRPYDTLQLKLTYFGRQENYQLMAVNGRATKLSYEEAGGATSKGEFGSNLMSIFEPGIRAEYRWDHWTTLRKRPAHVYFFRLPLSDSNYTIRARAYAGTGLYAARASRHGYVYVDAETNRVLRISWEAENIPLNFPLQHADSVLDYDFIDIGGSSYLLPISSQLRTYSGTSDSRNEMEFRDYRKFAADTSITFGDVKK